MDVEALSGCSEAELRPVLAILVRMSLVEPLDPEHVDAKAQRTGVLKVLTSIHVVNNLVALLSINLPSLQADVLKEIALRSKPGNAPGDSALVSSMNLGPELEFERSDYAQKMRLVLCEVISLMSQVPAPNNDTSHQHPGIPVQVKPSELYDHQVYLSEICDVLAIAMAEIPNLLSPPEVAEALLMVKYGPEIICHVVANQPEIFSEVVNHLLRNGERQDDEVTSAPRIRAIRSGH